MKKIYVNRQWNRDTCGCSDGVQIGVLMVFRLGTCSDIVQIGVLMEFRSVFR